MSTSETGDNIKNEVRFWNEPDLDEVNDNLSNDDKRELIYDLIKTDRQDTAEQLKFALENDLEDIYERVRPEITETAREIVDVNYQPDWAWSILSYEPDEIKGEVLEVPSGGAHKGLILAESGETLGLYPKQNSEISEIQHVERWALNLDNFRSLGYKVASPDYDRGLISFGEEEDEIEIPLITMNFNGEMILDEKLKDYASTFVSEEKAKELADEFKKRRKDSIVRLYSDLEPGDERFPEFEDTEKNSVFHIQNAHEAGEIVSSGTLDYTHNSGNVAYVLPENWHVGKVEPEEIYENSDMVVVDMGEYSDPTEEMLEEDPFLSEDQKDEYRDDDDEFDYRPRPNGGSNDHNII